jgi:outer membrane protein assembly factor BamB
LSRNRFYQTSFACVFGVLACLHASAAGAVSFSDIEGWWSAEPQFAGESSRVLLHFVNEEGKQSVRISLLAIGGYDVPIGTVSIEGDTLEMKPFAFPLTYDASKGTLSGHLPEAAVPVYRIPVEFRRIDGYPKPAAPVWNHPSPAIKWQTQVSGPVWAGLAHDAETKFVYVGTDSGVLHVIDERGAQRWKFETGKPIKARPAIIEDAVFIASDSGYLYKLDKQTGKERWRANIDVGSPGRIPTNQEKSRWDRYGSSAVADSKHVYVASRDKHLYAYDKTTGKERWRVASKDMITATPALHGDKVIFAAFDGSIRAVSASDGASRWQYEAKLPVSGDLAVEGDRVFAGSRTYDLIALNAADGKELWKHYYWFSWIESPPVVKDGTIYTGSSDAIGVYAIDSASGVRRWKTSVPGWAWARTAVDDRLVVAATVGQGPHPGVREGALVGIDRPSGKIRWMYLKPPSQEVIDKKREWGFAASPLLAQGIAYAADLDGSVYAFEANKLEKNGIGNRE